VGAAARRRVRDLLHILPFAGLEGHLKAVAVYEAWRQQGCTGAT
jgi:hypothetical protein